MQISYILSKTMDMKTMQSAYCVDKIYNFALISFLTYSHYNNTEINVKKNIIKDIVIK